MIRFALLTFLALAACSGGESSPPTERAFSCPAWQAQVTGADGGSHCVIAGDLTNVSDACNPIACESYFRWGDRGGGGRGATACAAACAAKCDDDPSVEALDLADAYDAGLVCVY